MKKILFVGALLLAVGIGVTLGPAIGLADTDDSTVTNRPYQGMMQKGEFSSWQGGQMGRGMMNAGFGLAGLNHDPIAEALGLTADELYELRVAGKSIAEVAEEKGISLEALTDSLVAAHVEQLDQLVADGRITEEQKTAMLENVEAMVASMINGKMPNVGGKGFQRMGGGKGFGLGPIFAGTNHEEIADFLGLTSEELTEQRDAGKSLAEIAQEKGISEEKLITKLTDLHKARLDQLVADGKITEEQKATFVENLDQKIKDMIAAKKSDFNQGKFHDKKGRRFMPDSSFQPGRGNGTYGTNTNSADL